ncbi:MAG TPA: ATP-binding cassette domain-containing protein [Kofleriaceae bacterium]|nr:ATP-binding cassette domain-containing protein [Kofleriaceae bacterium]
MREVGRVASTLIGLLNGSLHPTHGDVSVLGQNLTGMSRSARRQIQRQIGTIHQQLHLVNNLRAIHNINAGHLGRWSFTRALISMFWPLDVETAQRALEQVGIPEKIFIWRIGSICSSVTSRGAGEPTAGSRRSRSVRSRRGSC